MRTTIIHAPIPGAGSPSSGRHGRSFSLALPDAVTVLAKNGGAGRCGRDRHRQCGRLRIIPRHALSGKQNSA